VKRNIELKARCPDLAAARSMAKNIGATPPGAERQRDTYFRTPQGRLKLRCRQPDGAAACAELIWYRRSNEPNARGSDYLLTLVEDADQLRAMLAAALSVRAEVVKHRTIYLHDNVRIHLDEVLDLGTFIEFEAIVNMDCDDAAARAKLDRLIPVFGIEPKQVIGESYVDLLANAERGHERERLRIGADPQTPP